MTDPVTTGDESGAGRVLGGILYSLGLLVMGLSGLCTAGCFIGFLPDLLKADSLADALGMLGVGGVFGGVPFAVGYALFWLGRRLRRPSMPPGP